MSYRRWLTCRSSPIRCRTRCLSKIFQSLVLGSAAIVAIMGIGLWAYKRGKKNQPATYSAPVSYGLETELAEARSIEDPAARKDVLQGIAQRLRAYVYGPERPSYNGRTGTYAMESAEAAAKMGAAMKALPWLKHSSGLPSPISTLLWNGAPT